MPFSTEAIHLSFIFMLMYSPCLLFGNLFYYLLVIKPNRHHPVFRMRRPIYLGICLIVVAIHMLLRILIAYLEIISLLDTTLYEIIAGLMLGIGSSTVIVVRYMYFIH